MSKLNENTLALQTILSAVGNSSGKKILFQEKSVVPTSTIQTITPDEGYDGLSKVEVAAGLDFMNPPKTDFNGKWQKWFIEFYNGEPYWEAWFFTSGVLIVNGTYTADAWGIGGGGFEYNGYGGGSGYTNMIEGVELSGNVAVTIGAGGYYPNSGATSSMRKGGTTSLGDLLSCTGGGTTTGTPSTTGAGGSLGSDTAGSAGINGTPGDGYPMCRFRDLDKVGEAGCNTKSKGGNGWQHVDHSDLDGEGYGAGYGSKSSYYAGDSVHAAAGALVIRIKI